MAVPLVSIRTFVGPAVKVAFTVFGPSITTFRGLAEPEADPLQLENTYPVFGDAVNATIEPAA